MKTRVRRGTRESASAKNGLAATMMPKNEFLNRAQNIAMPWCWHPCRRRSELHNIISQYMACCTASVPRIKKSTQERTHSRGRVDATQREVPRGRMYGDGASEQVGHGVPHTLSAPKRARQSGVIETGSCTSLVRESAEDVKMQFDRGPSPAERVEEGDQSLKHIRVPSNSASSEYPQRTVVAIVGAAAKR